MTSLLDRRRNDGSKTPDRNQPKQYPSLKKSLSASFSISPSDSTEDVGFPPHGSQKAPSTPQGRAQSNPHLAVSIPSPSAAVEVALAALHYLPNPLLVLSSLKTVVLANEAMGRLLGFDTLKSNYESTENGDGGDEKPLLDRLVGRCLSEIGVHIMQNGQRVWVGWEVSITYTILRLLGADS